MNLKNTYDAYTTLISLPLPCARVGAAALQARPRWRRLQGGGQLVAERRAVLLLEVHVLFFDLESISQVPSS